MNKIYIKKIIIKKIKKAEEDGLLNQHSVANKSTTHGRKRKRKLQRKVVEDQDTPDYYPSSAKANLAKDNFNNNTSARINGHSQNTKDDDSS